jgi:glycosyltransferase involved in cell wall biosynthesis
MTEVKQPMRFHVVSLPHTNTTTAFSACAYTEKVRKFCNMMHDLGHEVILYAGQENEARCSEHVPCIDESLRAESVAGKHYTEASWDISLPHWMIFNATVTREIKRRQKPQDFICVIAGKCHQSIANQFPHLMTVEFGIGYSGTFSNYRVYESYAWMHTCYGESTTEATSIDGHAFHAVIPGYLDPKEFIFKDEKENYALFVGRLIDRKGIHVAALAAQHAGIELIAAGPGVAPKGVTHVGVVGPEKRASLMASARCLLAPTQYIEPFGNVAIEAMVCGTPVITSDWGAFTETNINGVTGYRCHTLAEYVQAIKDCALLDPFAIRDHVLRNYSVDVIALKYEAYFRRLNRLWGIGWADLTPPDRLGYTQSNNEKAGQLNDTTEGVDPCRQSEPDARRQRQASQSPSAPKSLKKRRKKPSRNS